MCNSLFVVLAFAPSRRLSFIGTTLQNREGGEGFALSFVSKQQQQPQRRGLVRPLQQSLGYGEDEDGDEDDEYEYVDPYTQRADSEFRDPESSALTFMPEDGFITGMDWGGALGKLKQRIEDTESGLAQDPSHVLFRVMSSQTPNQMIGQFVQGANPDTVQAMSGAVGSLLGGLSNPTSGIETLVRASGEKIGSLCFQLQMTGYMFRNAEYVLALKEVLDIKGKAGIEDYKNAFARLDKDGSGYIEASEIQELFDDVYKGNAPRFETEAFLKFFDQNDDGRISWDEFENGLGAAFATQLEKGESAARLLQTQEDYDEDDEDPIEINTNVSGKNIIDFILSFIHSFCSHLLFLLVFFSFSLWIGRNH